MPLTQHGVITEEAMLAYLKGELSPESTTQFEQLIADDPFAREALEGLQTANANTLKSTFATFSQKVAERTGAEKPVESVSFSAFARYAAAAVLIGALVGFAFLITNYFNNQSNQVALNQEPQQEKSSEPAPLFYEEPTEAKADERRDTALQTTTEVIEISRDAAVDESKPEPNLLAKSDDVKLQPITSNQPITTTVLATKKAEEKSMPIVQTERAAKEAKAKQNTLAGATAPKPAAAQADAAKQETFATSSALTAPPPQKPASGNEFSDDALDKLPDNMDAAMKNFNNRNYKAAAKQFGKIADKDHSNLDAVYFEGISQFINGDNNKALKNFEKLLEKNAKHTDGSKWYKAQILLKKNKKDEAKKLLNELKSSNGSFKDRAVIKLQEIE